VKLLQGLLVRAPVAETPAERAQDVDTAQDLRYPIASSGSTMSEAYIRSLRWRSPRPRASIHGT
jgi:hypothetical protein